MNDSEKLAQLWPWFKGNGNKGAGERLRTLEDQANGNKDTATMKKLDAHLLTHKENHMFQWATMVPMYLILLGMFLQYIGVI